MLDEREFTRGVQGRIVVMLTEAAKLASGTESSPSIIDRAMTTAEWCELARRDVHDHGTMLRAEERARALTLIRAVREACRISLDAQLTRALDDRAMAALEALFSSGAGAL